MLAATQVLRHFRPHSIGNLSFSLPGRAAARTSPRRALASVLSRLLLLGAAIVAAALAGGLAADGHSTEIGLLVAAAALGVLIARLPRALFGACLLILCYSPEYLGGQAGVFAHPQLPKGLIYFATLGIALSRGIRPRYLAVTAAYILMALLSWLNGQLNSALTITQVLSSFVTLTVGWTALAVDWRFDEDVDYLKVLAALPIACVLLGVVLDAAGVHTLFRISTGFDSSTRLQGASIPAQLALGAFIGAVTASICYRVTRWRWAPVLFALDALILGLTVSRGSSIALALTMAWPALRFAFGPNLGHRLFRKRWMRIASIGLIAALVVAYAVPPLLSRDTHGTYIQNVGVIHDSTSGRSAAWREFLVIARSSRWFGHGLGAGPITKIQEKGFLAQHNEYLRLFLEGGYIGGGIVLLTIIAVIATCIARSPRYLRIDLVGLALGFAVLSYTDNTLTSVNLQIPFCLVFGIASTWRARAPVTVRGRDTAPRGGFEPVSA